MQLTDMHKVLETLWDRYTGLRIKEPSEVQSESDELRETCQFILGKVESLTSIDGEPYAQLREAVKAISQRKIRNALEDAIVRFFETIEEICTWTDAEWLDNHARPSSIAVMCDAIEFIFYAEPTSDGDWPKEYKELLIFNNNLRKRSFLEVCENLKKTQKEVKFVNEIKETESSVSNTPELKSQHVHHNPIQPSSGSNQMHHALEAKHPFTHPCAGFWIRTVAYLVDGIILFVPSYIVEYIIESQIILHASSTNVDSYLALLTFFQFVFWLIVAVTYYARLESSKWQATIGKLAVGVKVVDIEGNKISFRRAVGRYFAKILSALILGIGFLMVGWTRGKIGLHDMIASTFVIYPKRLSKPKISGSN